MYVNRNRNLELLELYYELDPKREEIGEHREAVALKNLEAYLSEIGMSYYSPHKFRHAHIHLAKLC